MKNTDLLFGEMYIKLIALENVLIKKGIITEDELLQELENVSKEIINSLSKSHPDLVASMTLPIPVAAKKGDPTKN